MNRRHLLRGLAGGAAALGLPHPASAAGPIRFVTVHSEQGASAVYADQAGFFKRAGLNVAVSFLDSGAVILAGLAGGAADIGTVNPVSLAVAHQHGAPIVAFAPTAYYDSAGKDSLLLVAPNAPIRTAKDLNGKTIAINGLKNTPQFATQAWIDANGGDSRTVKFLEMPYGSMAQALLDGRIDAAFCAEPALSDARKVTRVLGDPYGAVAPRFFTGFYCTRLAYAQANPDVIRRLAAALRATAAWANGHPAETAQILVRVEKLDPAVVRTMTRADFAERLNPAEAQPPIDLAAKYGLLSSPIPARDLFWTGA